MDQRKILAIARDAVFETLWFTQKRSVFNKLYITTALWSTALSLSLVLNDKMMWGSSVDWLEDFLFTVTFKTRDMPLQTIHALFATTTVLVLLTAVLLSWVAYRLAVGQLHSVWAPKLLRSLLGLLASFSPVFARFTAPYITCDFLGDADINAPSLYWDFHCASSPSYIVLFAMSCVLLLFILGVTLVSTLMHDNNPKSFSLVARVHSRVDMAALAAGLAMALTFDIMGTHARGLQATIFLLVSTVLFLTHTFLQPYFHRSMNDFRSALFAMLMWAGLCSCCVTIAGDGTDGAQALSILFLVGFIPSLLGGVLVARLARRKLLAWALAPYGLAWNMAPRRAYTNKVRPEGPPVAALEEASRKASKSRRKKGKYAESDDEDAKEAASPPLRPSTPVPSIQVLAALGQGGQQTAPPPLPPPGTSSGPPPDLPEFGHMDLMELVDGMNPGIAGRRPTTLWEDIQAHLVETAARVLKKDGSPHTAPARLAVAEDILKRGVYNHPESAFLRLQLANLLFVDRKDRAGAVLWLDRAVGMDEAVALDWQFSSYRSKKAFARMDEHEVLGQGAHLMDTIAYEDMKKKLVSAVQATKDGAVQLTKLWKQLRADVKETPKVEVLGAKTLLALEEVTHYDTIAGTAFTASCSQGADTSPIVLQAYAKFLKVVRYDAAGSASLMRMAMEEDNAGKSRRAGSVAQSAATGTSAFSVSGSIGTQSEAALVELHKSTRVRKSALVLSFLQIVVLVSLLTAFILMSDTFTTAVMDVNDSGLRRFFTQAAMYRSRAMHRAAWENDTATFESQAGVLTGRMNAMWLMNTRLVDEIQPPSAVISEFYSNPIWPVKSINPSGGIEVTRLSGYELVARFVGQGLQVARSPMALFTEFNANPSAFPEFYYIFTNAVQTAQALDFVTGHYQLFAEEEGDLIVIVVALLASVAVALEVIQVFAVFRPALLAGMQRRLHSQQRLLGIPGAVAKAAHTVAETGLKEIEDSEESAESPVKETTFEDLSPMMSGRHRGPSEKTMKSVKSAKSILALKPAARKPTDTLAMGNQRKSVATSVANRRARIVYLSSLVFSVGVLVYFALVGITGTLESKEAAVNINNGGRRRFLASRCQHLAKELSYSAVNDPNNTLRNTVLEPMNTTETVRCQLDVAVKTMLMLHEAMVYGEEAGWQELPAARGWEELQADTPCSAFTTDPDILAASKRLPGARFTDSVLDYLYFEPNCLTDLPVSKDSETYTKDRITFYSKGFSPDKCTFFKEGDPMVSLGLHRFVEDMALMYLTLAGEPDSNLAPNHPALIRAGRYADESSEWALGMAAVVLTHQQRALDKLGEITTIMLVAFAVCLVAVAAQFFLLGNHLKQATRINVAQHNLVERLLNQSKVVQRLQKGAEMTYGRGAKLDEKFLSSSAAENARFGGADSDSDRTGLVKSPSASYVRPMSTGSSRFSGTPRRSSRSPRSRSGSEGMGSPLSPGFAASRDEGLLPPASLPAGSGAASDNSA